MIYLLKKCWILLLVPALYFGFGLYNNNFYLQMVMHRVETARQNPNSLHVVVLRGGTIPTGFVTGTEIAIEEIDQAAPGALTIHRIYSDSDSEAIAELNSLLRHDFRISAVIAEATTNLSKQAAVLCESYGVGLFLLNLDPPFRTSQGFKYVVKVEPHFGLYCQSVVDNLGLITDIPAHQEIRVGLFFDRNALGDDTLVNTLQGVIGSHNELYKAAKAIEAALTSGLLDPNLKLERLDDSFYIQSGLSIADTNLAAYLKGNTAPGLTVQEALDETPVLANPVTYGFVHGFEPGKFTSSRVSAATKASRLDVVIVIASLPQAVDLLQQIRDLKVKAPIVCIDYQPSGWVESNLGGLSENLYLVTCVDPSEQSVALDEFRRKFRQRALQEKRVVTKSDQSSVLAYESLKILADLVDEQNTTVPLEIMTILQMSGPKWPGLASENVGFDSVGDGAGRQPVLITLKDGDYVSVKRKEL